MNAPTVLDREAMIRRVGSDPELLLEMIHNFNEESQALLRDIQRSIVEHDASAARARRALPQGRPRTLAAPAASEAAARLEMMARAGDLSRVDEGFGRLEREIGALRLALANLG